MSANEETLLVTRIEEVLRERYPEAWMLKVHGGRFQRQGVPDLLAIIDGRFYGFEVKHQKPGETAQQAVDRATPGQRHEIAAQRRAGARAAVVLSPQDALDVIDGKEVLEPTPLERY